MSMKQIVQRVTGTTTNPGVPLFRRFKSQWCTIDIDYTDLSLLDTCSLPDWMQLEAWAEGDDEENLSQG